MSDGFDAIRVVARTAHYASSIALVGELVFALVVSRMRVGADTPDSRLPVSGGAGRFTTRAWMWWLVCIVSGALWLGVEAATMSGRPLPDAVRADVLGVVLTQTIFGRLWIARAAVAVVLAMALVRLGRRSTGRPILASAAILACVLLGTLAWAGHANAQTGWPGVVHRSVDILHLLAAGAWIGGLWPLASFLSVRRTERREPEPDAATVVARFSARGLVCVSTLVVTGLVNSWFTVGAPSNLIETDYGRLLLVKLGLFGVMLGVAAVNRASLTPRLHAPGSNVDVPDTIARRGSARALLRRNAMIEVALGFGILTIVGVLGTTMPAMSG